MKDFSGKLKRFRHNDSGSYTVMAALATTMLVAAAGYGIDTYRLENARTELDHIVGLTCDRVENADIALYPNTKSRIDMAKKFAPSQLPETALNPEHTSFKVVQNGDKVSVTGETEISATLMAVVGFSTLSGKSSRDCTPPSTKPPEKACTADDLIYLNPGKFEIAAGTLIAGQKNYAATLYDSKGNIKARQVVGNGSGVTAVFLNASDINDLVVVQPFNADGTTPAACNPTIPCKGDTKSCPPPDEPVCTTAKAEELAFLDPPYHVISKWARSPGLAALHANNMISYGSLKIQTAANFQPDTLFRQTAEDEQNPWTDPGLGYARAMAEVFRMPNNLRFNGSGVAKLFRVIWSEGAVWELNGQCLIAISPIVLDLIGKGDIATTGVSSARYVIPQHRVNATVDFDMGGRGKPVRTEWIAGNGQALLVDDRDGKATFDMNGKRLFGNIGGYAHGYQKLATFDANKDGKVSGEELNGLAAWIDNGDAKVQAGELKPVTDVGITELSTVMTETPTGDGGTHLRSTATMNGKTIMTEDVWFGVDLTHPQISDAGELQK